MVFGKCIVTLFSILDNVFKLNIIRQINPYYMSAFNILVGNYSKSAKSICYLGIWMIVPFVVYKINLIAISVLYSNKTTPLYEALKKKLESYGIIVSEKTPVIGY